MLTEEQIRSSLANAKQRLAVAERIGTRSRTVRDEDELAEAMKDAADYGLWKGYVRALENMLEGLVVKPL